VVINISRGYAMKAKINLTPPILWRDPKQFIAFGFGVGAIPIAPGTFGTLAGMPFFLLLAHLPWPIYLIVVMICFAAACWLCEVCSKEIGVHDHTGMVIDEIIGYLITMIAVPATAGWMWLGFVLFRLFDILKPWPISYFDKHVPGGFGVMFDDAVAALASCGILHLLMWTLGR